MKNIEKALANFPDDIANFINNLSDDRFNTLKTNWEKIFETSYKTRQEFINFYINETDYTFEDFLAENCLTDYDEHNKAYNTFLIEKYVFFWEYVNRTFLNNKRQNSVFYINETQKIKDLVRNEICYLLIEGQENILEQDIYTVCLVYPYNCNDDEVHILPIRNATDSMFRDKTDALNQIIYIDKTNGYIFEEE